jgi:hypothetical protein
MKKWIRPMNCYEHPDVTAVGSCFICGKSVCAKCATMVGRRIYCPDDLALAPAVRAAKTNGLAVISLVLGIMSLPLSCFLIGFFLGSAALIIGDSALHQIKQSRGKESGTGMALAGLAMGLISAIVAVAALILLLLGPVTGYLLGYEQ